LVVTRECNLAFFVVLLFFAFLLEAGRQYGISPVVLVCRFFGLEARMNFVFFLNERRRQTVKPSSMIKPGIPKIPTIFGLLKKVEVSSS